MPHGLHKGVTWERVTAETLEASGWPYVYGGEGYSPQNWLPILLGLIPTTSTQVTEGPTQ